MKISKFEPNCFYHIYNRSIGNELLFNHDNDFKYFICKMDRFINPHAKVYAYCLIPNHFHLLLKVSENKDLPAGVEDLPDGRKGANLDQSLKNLFNSYTRSYNIVHKRHGRLFQHGYKYKKIDSEDYLMWIIYYIHRNPVHHNITTDCSSWKFSSYNSIVKEYDKKRSDYIFNLYNGKKEFINFTSDLTKIFMDEIDN